MATEKKLLLLGLGIKAISHITKEAFSAIKAADIVIYLVNEPIMKEWLEQNSKKTYSLDEAYQSKSNRKESYDCVIDAIRKVLNDHEHICVVLYGHPMICSSIGAGVQKLQDISPNLNIQTFPAISAEDCLFSDLKIDPLDRGCFSVESTDFILHKHKPNPYVHNIIWQIGMTGVLGLPSLNPVNSSALLNLKNKLLDVYPPSFEVYLYEASIYPEMKPRVLKIKLDDLMEADVSPLTTLYIPPFLKSELDVDIAKLLGIQG